MTNKELIDILLQAPDDATITLSTSRGAYELQNFIQYNELGNEIIISDLTKEEYGYFDDLARGFLDSNESAILEDVPW